MTRDEKYKKIENMLKEDFVVEFSITLNPDNKNNINIDDLLDDMIFVFEQFRSVA